jgi:Cys-Gly metallodipeptidase DUG1
MPFNSSWVTARWVLLRRSVSGDASYRQHVFDMATFLKSELESLGVKVTLVELGKQILDGQEVQLPPAILGEIGNDKSKKTVGLYAHYDVQPVCIPCHPLSSPCGTR